MTVYVLVLVLFLTGGATSSRSATQEGATKAMCEEAAAAVPGTLIGKSVPTDQGDMVVLDAQAFCIPVTKQEPA